MLIQTFLTSLALIVFGIAGAFILYLIAEIKTRWLSWTLIFIFLFTIVFLCIYCDLNNL